MNEQEPIPKQWDAELTDKQMKEVLMTAFGIDFMWAKRVSEVEITEEGWKFDFEDRNE